MTNWSGFTFLFLGTLLLSTGLQLWLAWRHIRYVSQHRDAVPPAFADDIPLAEHQKAADYTAAKGRLGYLDLALSVVLLLAWTLGGGLGWLDALWQQTGWPPLVIGTAVILSMLLINAAVELPLSAYRTFGLEQRFGFNRSTPALYVMDLLKGLLVALALGVPLLLATLWFMQATGAWWWLWVWALWQGFTLFITWAYPALIAPLFNKFSPLTDEMLKSRIETLLARCGFKSRGVFVMDGSRRSAHGNAYFTGMGNNKRIVFFDTLLDSLTPAQIEAVLAHELGHFRLRHITKRLLVSAAMSLAALALLGWLAGQAWFYTGLGVAYAAPHLALLLFMLAGPSFLFLLTPLSAMYSRKHEFEADAYATEQSDATELAAALVRLYRDNANTLTPDPIHSAFYDSHPPAPVRIARLQTING